MRRLITAFAALAVASPAAAEMKQVEPGHYLCAAPAGYAQNQDIVPLQVGEQLRLRVRLNKENFDPRWTVSAAVEFEAKNGRRSVVIGKARDEKAIDWAPHLFVALQTSGKEARKIVDRFPLTDDWVSVTLKMDAAGVVTVRSRNRTELLDLGGTQISKALLHCHSGEFEMEISPQLYVLPATAH